MLANNASSLSRNFPSIHCTHSLTWIHLGEICPDIQATSDMRIDPRHLLPSYSGCIWHNPESAQPTVRLFMRSISAVWLTTSVSSSPSLVRFVRTQIYYAAHNRESGSGQNHWKFWKRYAILGRKKCWNGLPFFPDCHKPKYVFLLLVLYLIVPRFAVLSSLLLSLLG